MSVFRFDKAFGAARAVKGALKKAFGTARNPNAYLKRRRLARKVQELSNKRQEISKAKKESRVTKERLKELHTAKGKRVEKIESKKSKKSKKRAQQKIFQLEKEMSRLKREASRLKREASRLRGKELRDAKERAEGTSTDRLRDWWVSRKQSTLPDFVIIGAKKGGTTFLYDLLTRHPHVKPAAKKELHFFDILFDEEGVEWYRRCFPPPRWKDGRRTITGEATPYLGHPPAPERMAKVVPRARLIALLRNPVDRAYSDYQQVVRKGRETRTFEETIEKAIEAIEFEKTLPLGEEDNTSEHEDRANLDDDDKCYRYVSRGIYIDHLRRWSKFFGDEQMLVLKSEHFFERPLETLKPVLQFLDLPDWEPEVWESGKQERYAEMDPTTKRLLEEYFEPHNKKLYDFLGRDFGW